MDVKRDLFEERAKKELSVAEFFPRYTKKLVDSKINFLSDEIATEEKNLEDIKKRKEDILEEFWQEMIEEEEYKEKQ